VQRKRLQVGAVIKAQLRLEVVRERNVEDLHVEGRVGDIQFEILCEAEGETRDRIDLIPAGIVRASAVAAGQPVRPKTIPDPAHQRHIVHEAVIFVQVEQTERELLKNQSLVLNDHAAGRQVFVGELKVQQSMNTRRFRSVLGAERKRCGKRKSGCGGRRFRQTETKGSGGGRQIRFHSKRTGRL
jgi:hypothetical protein